MEGGPPCKDPIAQFCNAKATVEGEPGPVRAEPRKGETRRRCRARDGLIPFHRVTPAATGMTKTGEALMVSRAEVNHTFTDTELDELKAFGTTEPHKAGDLLVEEGAMAPDCILTLSGHTDIYASTDEGRKRVGWMERGQFAGDLSVLTGQRLFPLDEKQHTGFVATGRLSRLAYGVAAEVPADMLSDDIELDIAAQLVPD